MNLKDILQKDTSSMVSTVDFNGLKFEIKYVSKAQLQALTKRCVIWRFDRELNQRTQQVDQTKFSAELFTAIMKSWNNVTIRTVSKVVPIKLKEVAAEDLDKPLPMTLENFQFLIENAFGLDSFLQESAVDLVVFGNDEEVLKNSSASQSGS